MDHYFKHIYSIITFALPMYNIYSQTCYWNEAKYLNVYKVGSEDRKTNK